PEGPPFAMRFLGSVLLRKQKNERPPRQWQCKFGL
ncbi:MAG: hypothetical protein ACI9PZ_000594, partial [Parvicella sp.]